MSIKRLKIIENCLLRGTKTDNGVTYSKEDIKTILEVLEKEISTQDRSMYHKKYYQENKGVMDERTKNYYHSHTERVKEIQKRSRVKKSWE